MFCNKCGKEVEETSKFCTNCGNSLEGYLTKGTITFERQNQFYGVLIPIKIFIDGKLITSVAAGKSEKVSMPFGKHRIAFDIWSGNGQYDIEITEKAPNVKVVFKLGVGAITSKPKIVSITKE